MDSKGAKKCSKCKSQVEYKNGFCIDCFRKFGQPKRSGKRAPPKGKNSGSSEAVGNLLSSVKKQQKFGKLLTYSMGCLTKMAVDQASIEDIVNQGAIEAAMGGMNSNPEDESVTVAINDLVKASAVNPELTAAVCGRMKGQFGGFVTSLKNHVSEDTLLSTCQTMAALSKDPAGREGLAEVGGIEAMADCLKLHKGNKEMMRAGAGCLAQFASDPRYAKQIMESGAVDLILDAMKRFPNDPELAEAASQLIANLAKASPDIAKQLKSMGAMEALVDALEQFPYSETILQAGQSGMQYLAGETDVSAALGQITRGTVMPDSKTAKAVSRIAALSLVGSNVDYLHKHGGVEACISVIKDATGQGGLAAAGILTGGARTLQRLGTDETKRYAIMKAGGVRALVAQLQQHVKDAAVAEASLSAIAAIMTRKDNAVYVAKVGGLDACLEAIDAHPNNVHVAKAAINFMSGMAKFEESAGTLIDGGGVNGLVKILQNHIKNPEVVRAAVETLAKIAEYGPGRQAILDADALPLLVQAINEHPEDPEVIKASLKAMEKALQHKDAAEILRAAGAVDAVAAALDRYPGDSELQALGQRVLKLLAKETERKEAVKKAEAKREKIEDFEQKKKRAEQELIDAEYQRNLAEWQLAEEKRKMDEAERLRAYEDMKLREAELASIKFRDEDEIARQRKAELEDRQKKIQNMRDEIQKAREDRVHENEERERKRRENIEKEAFKKFHSKVNEKPDLAAVARKERMKDLLKEKGKGKDGDDTDSDYDV